MSREPGTYAHFTTNQGTFVVKLFDDVAPKTVATVTPRAHERFDINYRRATLPHDQQTTRIALFATTVAPRVR